MLSSVEVKQASFQQAKRALVYPEILEELGTDAEYLVNIGAQSVTNSSIYHHTKGRKPVIVYGRDASPVAMYDKFGKLSAELALDLTNQFIPVTGCWLKDHDVVYSGFLRKDSSPMTTLVESKDTKVEVKIAWLTEEQYYLLCEIENSPESKREKVFFDVESLNFSAYHYQEIVNNHGELKNIGFPIPSFVSKEFLGVKGEQMLASSEVIAQNRVYQSREDFEILQKVSFSLGLSLWSLIGEVCVSEKNFRYYNKRLSEHLIF